MILNGFHWWLQILCCFCLLPLFYRNPVGQYLAVLNREHWNQSLICHSKEWKLNNIRNLQDKKVTLQAWPTNSPLNVTFSTWHSGDTTSASYLLLNPDECKDEKTHSLIDKYRVSSLILSLLKVPLTLGRSTIYYRSTRKSRINKKSLFRLNSPLNS